MPCPAGACRFPAASPCTPQPHPTSGATHHEASTRVHAIHPSGLPLACNPPDGTVGPWAFPCAPHPAVTSSARQGGAGREHAPETTRPTCSALQSASSLARRDLVSQRQIRTLRGPAGMDGCATTRAIDSVRSYAIMVLSHHCCHGECPPPRALTWRLTTVAGTPNSRDHICARAPLLSHATARPRRAGTSFESQAQQTGRRIENQPTGTSQRYDPGSPPSRPGRNAYQQLGGSRAPPRVQRRSGTVTDAACRERCPGRSGSPYDRSGLKASRSVSASSCGSATAGK
jgi:hypothetical protein